MAGNTDDTIRVLHVDDEPELLELTAAFLERESEAFDVVGETSAEAALDRLEDDRVDCVVSDYEMPGMDGQAFLEAVRARRPALPFVLFTGQGSEEVASAAISAGVTDYMQKSVGSSQYEVLANRIRNAVENYRTRSRYDRQRQAIETAREGIAMLDADGRFTYVNRAYAALYGYEPEEMVDEHWALVYPEDGVARTRDEILPVVERAGRWRGETVGLRADGTTFVEDHSLAGTDDGGLVCIVREVTGEDPTSSDAVDPARVLENAPDMVHVVDDEGIIRYANPAAATMTGYARKALVGSHIERLMDEDDLEAAREFIRERLSAWPDVRSAEFEWTLHTADGEAVLCDSNVRPLFVEGEWVGLVGVVRDVSDRIEREQLLTERKEEVERQNERLETLASVVSHDLRNPLNVAMGRLELAGEDCESEHLADVAAALSRVEEIIEGTLTLVREWRSVEETTPVTLESFVTDCWENVATGAARLDVEGAPTILADPSRLRNLLENLLRNAVEHGGADVTVSVGPLPDGFYVEDDGEGIPASEREQVFEAGYTTLQGGTGLGLHIVGAIARAHGWAVRASVGNAGGARFEVTGVDVVED